MRNDKICSRKRIAQIKKELENLGFKTTKNPLGGKAYVYGKQQMFSLRVRFYNNLYCAAQIIIDMDHYINSFLEILSVNIEPANINSLIPSVKKSIKIVDRLNKNFAQIRTDIEKFNEL